MEPIKLNIKVDTEKINQALRNTSDRLSVICNSPEFQAHIERLNQESFVLSDRILNAVNTGLLYRSIGIRLDERIADFNAEDVDWARRQQQSYNYGLFETGRLELIQQSSHLTLGNQNCINNAHSIHLQCAINPTGDCAECPHLEAL